jgi:hypothetical protein
VKISSAITRTDHPHLLSLPRDLRDGQATGRRTE